MSVKVKFVNGNYQPGPTGPQGPQGFTGAASTVTGPTGATGATGSVSYSATVNAQTGTSYTIQASDNGKVVTFSNAAGITVTVPASLGAGFNCVCIQIGAGQVTFQAGASATINNRQSHTKIAGQKGIATLVASDASVYYLGGDTAA